MAAVASSYSDTNDGDADLPGSAPRDTASVCSIMSAASSYTRVSAKQSCHHTPAPDAGLSVKRLGGTESSFFVATSVLEAVARAPQQAAPRRQRQ